MGALCCGVETLRIFKVPLCVGSVLWCEDFETFQISPVCELCAVVCEDFENFQSSSVCGLCTVVCDDFENFQSSPVCVERLIIFAKIPIGIFSLYWRDWFFRVKNPCAGDFPPVVEH